ncbi:MAG: hypothetical protein JWN85_4869 [Gammaproteobacteria bacterium]|nr:hypothetical protein [Gammaproteobacteria bacterium]
MTLMHLAENLLDRLRRTATTASAGQARGLADRYRQSERQLIDMAPRRASRGQVWCWALLVILATVPLASFAVGVTGVGTDPNLVGVRTPGVRAQPFGVGPEVSYIDLSVGLGETDNVLLSRSDTKFQTMALAGVDFEVRRRGTRLNTDLKGDFAYLDYLQHAYSKQLIGRLDGEATFALFPEWLTWVVDDSFGESAVSPYESTTPSNLEKINVVSTGPEIVLRPGQAIFLRLNARYAYSYYESSPFDSKRTLGTATIGRDLSRTSSVSLNVVSERLRFKNTVVNTNYDRRKLYIGCNLRGSHTDFSANGGATQANDRGHWVTTPLVELDATRTLSRSSKLSFLAGRQFIDIADAFRSLRSGAAGGIVVAPVVGTTANYLSSYASGGWAFERHRTSFEITGRWERDAYDSQHSALNVTRGGVELRVGRRMSSTLTAEAFGALYRENYAGQRFSDAYGVLGGAIALKPGRSTGFRVRYEHNRRTSSGAGGAAYIENRVFLVAEYFPLQ